MQDYQLKIKVRVRVRVGVRVRVRVSNPNYIFMTVYCMNPISVMSQIVITQDIDKSNNILVYYLLILLYHFTI